MIAIFVSFENFATSTKARSKNLVSFEDLVGSWKLLFWGEQKIWTITINSFWQEPYFFVKDQTEKAEKQGIM